MNEDKEFQKKVQVAVDSYLGKRDKQSQMVEQIQNVIEREQLIDQVQKLLVELITKLTERFISNLQQMKNQVENEILKLRQTIRSTHQRTYSAVDKEKLEDQVQRTLNKHEVQINMLLEHQQFYFCSIFRAQLKQLRSEAPINEKWEISIKKDQETLKHEIDEQLKSFQRNYNCTYLYFYELEKQQTIMQILNDLVVKIEKIEVQQQQQQSRLSIIGSDKKQK
ncbi:unnamed protein product (macronuclear) [Paramecium tetraurelia]|uniref:Uncharacterized protein n=1 Tax=Paramecium tetraurelia TaxID=5888 RepID=A0BX27_PARTE|nr:uncharacterized protein GSPATT00032946001 [Paramecium tetraurelia]CAK63094.1 unnamed protein product [Paramecium tetraurelia]|eukprot:XP_001430492.1 hypothetical protein (macronuclear) [Paramecium tetraurelia strain d4-2]